MRRLETAAVPACLDEVHALLAGLWADAPGVGEQERARLTIAVAELAANVVEHGRTPGGGPPHLVLTLAAEPGRLVAGLVDDGVGFPPEGEMPEDPLAEHGRGLALARAAVDEIDYARRNGRNHWHLVVERGG